MSEYKDMFNEYVDEILIRDFDDFITIAPPIFFLGSHDSIAVRVEKNENGCVVSDCHTVQDYWDEYVDDLEKYSERIQNICDKFGLYRDGNSFCMQVYGYWNENPHSVRKQIGNFLQAMFLLGNVFI